MPEVFDQKHIDVATALIAQIATGYVNVMAIAIFHGVSVEYVNAIYDDIYEQS